MNNTTGLILIYVIYNHLNDRQRETGRKHREAKENIDGNIETSKRFTSIPI